MLTERRFATEHDEPHWRFQFYRESRSHHARVQVVGGAVTVNGTPLGAGDGASVSEETALDFKAGADSEILLFDLA
jgi:redox-sensitive bicupin YhaK (pirin superfamily)